EKEDSDIEFIEVDPDEEEPERKTLFTDDFFQTHKDLREATQKFFDPSSPTNIANISQVVRMEMAKYAAAMFEW
ncbi:hypothetical protein PENTCL1PPCAC_13176, partial [Pristionchus entomophagus]